MEDLTSSKNAKSRMRKKKRQTKAYIESTSEQKNKGKKPDLHDNNERVQSGSEVNEGRKQRREKREDSDEEEEEKFPGDAHVAEKKIQRYRRGNVRADTLPSEIKQATFRTHAREKFIAKESKNSYASRQAARAELLLTEQTGYMEADEGEHTSEFTQADIVKEVDIASAEKYFQLKLDQFGPYRMNYNRNGRHLLLGGAKGHIAALNWENKKLTCELNVMETCHDVKWLHIETMFAVAQKKWVYIYDNQGIELHCLKNFDQALRLEFLPYHFLLAGASANGFLRWVDTSIGESVAGFHTHQGRLDVMCQNPRNAILHLGHGTGTVTLWSPNVSKPLVKMLCHHGGGVRSIAIDNTGLYMATSGIDRKVKIWDLRNYQELNSCKIGHGAASLSFSQNGLLSAAIGNVVEIYKDPRLAPITEPYERHRCSAPVQCVQFCPYEDILGASHNGGFDSILVPGAGEANFDTLEANPYQTTKQRQHGEVKMLLDKIQPDMITLDTTVLGQVNMETAEEDYQKQVEARMIQPRRVEFPDSRKISKSKKSKKYLHSKKGARDDALRNKQQFKSKMRNKHGMTSLGGKKNKDKQFTGVFERFKRKDV